MECVLRHGTDSSVRLELPDDTALAHCGMPRGVPLEDPAAAVVEALAEPLDYPALIRSTTPGDRVVLALDTGVPRVAEIVAAVVRSLADCGVDPDGITVLRTRADADTGVGDPCRLVPEEIKERIALATHDPTTREKLAYLAATEAGEPVLLNRAIHDADLVLPIGCFRSEESAGYFGIFGTLYPTFSDTRTLMRYRSPGTLDLEGRHRRRLLKTVNEVGWLLGVTLTVQVVPGAGNAIQHVLAGACDSVGRQGRQLYDAAWNQSVPRRATLVVAGIEGGPEQQTWRALGQTLSAAARLIEDDGAIVVCCDLATRPGPAVQRLSDAHSRDAALRRIRKDRPDDALPAMQLAQALDRGNVYLLSRLEQSLVEDLDVTPVARPDELARLVRQFESCIVLSNAPHAAVTVEAEN